MTESTVVTRDRSSGMVHLRVRRGKQLLSDEACNLDDAGEFDILAEIPTDDANLCARCFPDTDFEGEPV